MITRARPIQSNAATFADFIAITDDDGVAIPFSDITEITVNVTDPHCCVPPLSASKTGGTVTARDDGSSEFSFTPTQMAGLRQQTYEFSVFVTVAGVTSQTHRCPLPVVEAMR